MLIKLHGAIGYETEEEKRKKSLQGWTENVGVENPAISYCVIKKGLRNIEAKLVDTPHSRNFDLRAHKQA